MSKRAQTDHPVLDLIAARWSPRAFSSRPVEEAKLSSVLEAARWAPSAGNEQPWRFIVATKAQPDAYAALLGCLKEKNQSWARSAPVLMLTLAKRHFRDDEARPNPHAWHDLGQALASMSLQATALGLAVHPMAGFSPERAREAFALPPALEPVTALALGYPGDPETLPRDLQVKERAPRRRKPLRELVLPLAWGEEGGVLGGVRRAPENAPSGAVGPEGVE